MNKSKGAGLLDRFDVSRETLRRFESYDSLLRKWNPAINLVSSTTLDDLWTRHFIDSAQIFDLAPVDIRSWADLGAGGGFPGLVVAILAKQKAPELVVTLVESDRRKSAFLSTVSRELALNTVVRADRIEALPPLQSDVISARALAPLDKLLEYSVPHLSQSGVTLFPKGGRWEEEVARARENWSFDLTVSASQTDPNGVILKISGAQRV